MAAFVRSSGDGLRTTASVGNEGAVNEVLREKSARVRFSNEQRQQQRQQQRQLPALLQHPSDRSLRASRSQWPTTRHCVVGDRSFPRPGCRWDESSPAGGAPGKVTFALHPPRFRTASSRRGRVRAKDGWPPSRGGLEGHWEGRMLSERSARCWSSFELLLLRCEAPGTHLFIPPPSSVVNSCSRAFA
jgi:hypothetical protein